MNKILIKLRKYCKNPIKESFYVLQRMGFFDNWDDEEFLKRKYKLCLGKELNLRNPKSFNEKLQWLKLYDRNPLYTLLVDKYEVKKYIKEKLGEEYVIPTLGVWNDFDEIDFSILPEQFVLKCTHDSGGLVICRDKSKFEIKSARAKIRKSLKKNFYYGNREWPYKNVKPRVIAEQYMEDENINDDCRGLTDYKFFCFDNEPMFIYISKGLEDHSTAKISFYDMDGNEMYFHRNDFEPYHNAIMPSQMETMKVIAKKLAKEVRCPFVRIDLYCIKNHVYFSEITFSPCAGMIPFEPKIADEELGKMLILPIDVK